MKYRLVIFDFDGTLADTFPWFIGVFDAVAEKYGMRRVDKSEVEVLRGLSAGQIIQRLGVSFWKIPFLAAHVRRLIGRDIQHVQPFPGARELVHRLAEAGVTLALVSSNSEANVRQVLGPETAASIRYYECGASLFGKARRFRRVLKRSGISAREALCIGDEIRDLDSARQAGIPFGAVAWGFTTPQALQAQSPAMMFQRMEDIAAAVL